MEPAGDWRGNAKKVNQTVYSQYMTGNLKANYFTGTIFRDNWDRPTQRPGGRDLSVCR